MSGTENSDSSNLPTAENQSADLLAQESTPEVDQNSKYLPPRPVEHRRNSDIRIQQTVSHHIGPLPHPEILAGYEAVLPGLAGRIVDSFELQAKHRMDLERAAMKAGSFSQKWGTIFAGTMGMGSVAGAIYLGIHGQSAVSIGVVLTSMAGLVIAFRSGKAAQANDLQAKKQERHPAAQRRDLHVCRPINLQPAQPCGGVATAARISTHKRHPMGASYAFSVETSGGCAA